VSETLSASQARDRTHTQWWDRCPDVETGGDDGLILGDDDGEETETEQTERQKRLNRYRLNFEARREEDVMVSVASEPWRLQRHRDSVAAWQATLKADIEALPARARPCSTCSWVGEHADTGSTTDTDTDTDTDTSTDTRTGGPEASHGPSTGTQTGKWVLDKNKLRTVTFVTLHFVCDYDMPCLTCTSCGTETLINPNYLNYFPANPVKQVGRNFIITRWVSVAQLRFLKLFVFRLMGKWRHWLKISLIDIATKRGNRAEGERGEGAVNFALNILLPSTRGYGKAQSLGLFSYKRCKKWQRIWPLTKTALWYYKQVGVGQAKRTRFRFHVGTARKACA